MTTQPIRGVEPAAAAEEAASRTTSTQHPDFFERHPGVLARLRCRTSAAAPTVSLVERQVQVLRDKHATLEQKLREFDRVARANDALADKIHRLTRRLLRGRDCNAVIAGARDLAARGLRRDRAGADPDHRSGARALEQRGEPRTCGWYRAAARH